jgi:hypothetical protein
MAEMNVPRSRDFRKASVGVYRLPCAACGAPITDEDAADNVERDATGTRLQHRVCWAAPE